MPPYVFAVAGHHAAKILRPGVIQGGVDDHSTDPTSAQFLRLRRKAQERVDLSVRKQFDRRERVASNPMDVFDWIEPDMSGHYRREHKVARLQARYANFFTLQVPDATDAFVNE